MLISKGTNRPREDENKFQDCKYAFFTSGRTTKRIEKGKKSKKEKKLLDSYLTNDVNPAIIRHPYYTSPPPIIKDPPAGTARPP